MDYQEYFEAQQQNMSPRYQLPQKPNALATGAMVCGIVSIFSIFLCFLPLTFILAPCSIVLALLSKGNQKKMHRTARLGIAASIGGYLVYGVTVGSVVFLFYTSQDYRQSVFNMTDQMCEANYGMGFDELTQQLYGDDFDIYEFFRIEPKEAAEENITAPEASGESTAAPETSRENSAVPETLTPNGTEPDIPKPSYYSYSNEVFPEDITSSKEVPDIQNFEHSFYPLS